MNEITGRVAELFASIQGEGAWIGRRQLFLRLAGCQEECAYCDTAWARASNLQRWKIQPQLTAAHTSWMPNPVSAADMANVVSQACTLDGPFHSLAITGGEPLEQAEFVYQLTGHLRRQLPSLLLMLETNGLHAREIQRLKGRIDFVAADIKLTSAIRRPWRLSRHAQFLRAAKSIPGCVKSVIVPSTPTPEIRAAARLAFKQAPEWDFVLQPAARFQWKNPKQQAVLLALTRAATAIHPGTRMIPQMHRLMEMP